MGRVEAEVDNLSIMYEGDQSRDASDKIRGFLFQDYVAIKCLLKNGVESICVEYLEDIDVFYEDGLFEFIQVKYYPKTAPKMKEIAADLYYQYLRLKMLGSDFKLKPSLYIYRDSDVKKPTFDEMKRYIGLKESLPKVVHYPTNEMLKCWLRHEVYKSKKKDFQKNMLFSFMASEYSLNDFIEKFYVDSQVDIIQYEEDLMSDLIKAYPCPEETGEEKIWKNILLGLAIIYVQRRYVVKEGSFEQIQMTKDEFNQYMSDSVKTMDNQTIAGYLMGLVCERYREIMANNDMSTLQLSILDLIYQNTLKWINELGKSVDGQYRLINTISIREAQEIDKYKEKSFRERMQCVVERRFVFMNFLGYFWKIMLDICQEKIHDKLDIEKHSELYDPLNYIDDSVINYICMNFPEDKYVDRCIIVPPAAGEFKRCRRKIVGRMINITPKPMKWFFQNSKIKKGKNYYKYSTNDVNENPSIADLGKDSFYIECMDCIGIDEDEWEIKEECKKCIFSLNCIKE